MSLIPTQYFAPIAFQSSIPGAVSKNNKAGEILLSCKISMTRNAVGVPKIIIQHLHAYLIIAVYVMAIIKMMKDLRFVGEVQQCIKICGTRLTPALATENARWLKNQEDLKPSSLRKT